MLKNSETHYGHIARIAHWTSAALMLMSIMLGIEIPTHHDSADQLPAIARHCSYGLALFGIMLARFAWRLHNHNPVASYTLPSWHRRGAISLHWFLYAAVMTQCAVGIGQLLASTTSPGLFGGNLIIPGALADAELHIRLNDVHAAMAKAIYAALGLHVTAAIYHQIFGVRDPKLTPDAQRSSSNPVSTGCDR